mmetsp:Transcript_2/g.23  ORF Transcript_2/g.23 Transcript_2/m.23 type:complete len:143 (+) Transcript_2:1717-2145(+)
MQLQYPLTLVPLNLQKEAKLVPAVLILNDHVGGHLVQEKAQKNAVLLLQDVAEHVLLQRSKKRAVPLWHGQGAGQHKFVNMQNYPPTRDMGTIIKKLVSLVTTIVTIESLKCVKQAWCLSLFIGSIPLQTQKDQQGLLSMHE